MFEISELKAKKLPELQEIAKASGVPKYRSLKKLDLVYKILTLAGVTIKQNDIAGFAQSKDQQLQTTEQ